MYMNYVSMGPIDELSVILRCSSIIGTKEIECLLSKQSLDGWYLWVRVYGVRKGADAVVSCTQRSFVVH